MLDKKQRGIDRRVALKELPYICVVCGATDKLELHHGRRKNEFLCCNCHDRYHELKFLREFKSEYKWQVIIMRGEVSRFIEELESKPSLKRISGIFRAESRAKTLWILSRILSWWSLAIPSSEDEFYKSYQIAEELRQQLLKQINWRFLVRDLTKAREELKTIKEE